jgi:hypothetical protein
VGRLLHLPTPTPLVVDAVAVVLVASALAGIALTLAARRVPASWPHVVVGAAVALAYGEWMVVAMSYGKVDHDRFALLTLLAVTATVGRARLGESRPSEAAGWAVRCVQVAVVATYFLAAVAKFRFGGWGWVNGSTLVWAVIRRGTVLGDPLLHVPWLLHITQWGIVAMELGTPALLVLDHARRVAPPTWRRPAQLALTAYLAGLLAFHVLTFATISILFLPHVVCLLAFVPLERLGTARAAVAGRGRARPAQISRARSTPSPAAPGSRRGAPAEPASAPRSA